VVETLSLQPLPLQAEALRSDVRNFLEEKLRGVPPEQRARSWLGFDADFSRALGERGWIGTALPQEYGGLNSLLKPYRPVPRLQCRRLSRKNLTP